MIYKLIENYIHNMSENDVDKFAKENGVTLSLEERDIIYRTIKTDWHTILYGDYSSVFQNLNGKISPNTLKKAEELFLYFKDKYQKFL